MGSILGASSENIVVNTNLGTYTFLNQSAPNEPGSAFFGFRAGAGEFFTSFLITDLTTGTYAALDGVTLGVAPVPEPNMLSMMIAGLLLLALAAHRRTKTD